jgi:hypothetical protein
LPKPFGRTARKTCSGTGTRTARAWPERGTSGEERRDRRAQAPVELREAVRVAGRERCQEILVGSLHSCLFADESDL